MKTIAARIGKRKADFGTYDGGFTDGGFVEGGSFGDGFSASSGFGNSGGFGGADGFYGLSDNCLSFGFTGVGGSDALSCTTVFEEQCRN